MLSRILVTGGSGFIGAAVVRHLVPNKSHEVAKHVKLTYAGNLNSPVSIGNSSRYRFYQVDIWNAATLDAVSPSYSLLR